MRRDARPIVSNASAGRSSKRAASFAPALARVTVWSRCPRGSSPLRRRRSSLASSSTASILAFRETLIEEAGGEDEAHALAWEVVANDVRFVGDVSLSGFLLERAPSAERAGILAAHLARPLPPEDRAQYLPGWYFEVESPRLSSAARRAGGPSPPPRRATKRGPSSGSHSSGSVAVSPFRANTPNGS
jgi:hypothetical protein